MTDESAATEMEPLKVPQGSSLPSYQNKATTSESLDSCENSKDRHRHDRPQRWMLSTASVVVCLIVLLCLLKSARNHENPMSFDPRTTAVSQAAMDTCANNGVDPVITLKPSSVKEGLKNGAVAADHPVCSEVGLRILQEQNGNAVDAAVAVTLCLGVANPASSGLGGGAFLLVHADETDLTEEADVSFIDARQSDADAKAESVSGKLTEVIDCREIAPAAATKLMYNDLPKHASERGGLANGIPGELKCLELAHARHGRLSWTEVVQPAYELASSGVEINANLAHEIGILKHRYSLRYNKGQDWGLRALLTHFDTWESAKKEGDIIKNKALAGTLRAIRDGGADAFYKGDRAAKLAKDIQDAGGIVTQEDIENYKPTLRSPIISHDIHGFSIVGVPPPSSGGAVIIGAARFLAAYFIPFATYSETLSVHRLVEACKHAFAIRMSLSDPLYATDVNKDAVKDLVEGDYMKKLNYATSDVATLSLSQYGGDKWALLKDTDGNAEAIDANEGDRRKLARRFGNLEDNGTSHFSIVDKDGNAVSMTTSVNTYFGSNVLSKSAGIVLSNTMDDFSTPGRPNYYGLHPSEANFIKPGKKPLSSMAPTMVFRRPNTGDTKRLGDLTLVLGASGGPKIISAVLQVLAHVIFQGMPLFEALIHPRIHDQLIYHGSAVCTTETTVLEQGPGITVSQKTRNALTSRGHDLLDVTYEGTVQAISIDLETKEITAACDVRKGGSPAGY